MTAEEIQVFKFKLTINKTNDLTLSVKTSPKSTVFCTDLKLINGVNKPKYQSLKWFAFARCMMREKYISSIQGFN